MLSGMNHITLAVKDIEKSFIFYRDILGLKPLCKWEKGAYFLVENTELNNTPPFWFCLNLDANRRVNPCYTHYAFSIPIEQFNNMADKITTSGATIFKDNTSPGDSLYFFDPDGHKLEIHVGNWQARIAAKKENLGSWKNVEWFV